MSAYKVKVVEDKGEVFKFEYSGNWFSPYVEIHAIKKVKSNGDIHCREW